MSIGLKVENVSKIYDKNTALKNISLNIEPGEFVCLLGPSGCGKSTLLRLIAGLETPNEGKIYLGGKDATFLPPAKRNFGIMFQSYALFPNLTAFENVAYGLRNRKMKEKEITARVEELFQMIHLESAKDRVPAQLSGGEQQRVALARALAVKPDFLLLDEPLSALDAKVRQELRKQICSIQKEMGMTTIMVTHDQDEALTMADRIVVMNKAVIMQEGTPEEVYQRPVNPFVADFIGSINFMKKNEGTDMDLWKNLSAIRPEKVQISHEMSSGSIPGKIEYIEFRGSFYRVSIGAQRENEILNVNVDVPFTEAKRLRLNLSDNIYFSIPQEEILHFRTA